MKKKPEIEIPKNIISGLAEWERIIRRADKQKLRQPLNKPMTPDVYTSWILRQKSE